MLTAESFDATAFHLDSSAIPARHRTHVYARLPCQTKNTRDTIKETGVFFGNFEKSLYEVPRSLFYGRGLKFYSPQEVLLPILKQCTISCHICLAQYLKRYHKSSTVVRLRLNTLRRTKTAFFLTLLKCYDKHPALFCMQVLHSCPEEEIAIHLLFFFSLPVGSLLSCLTLFLAVWRFVKA